MNFNKCFIGGNLTRDVELRYTPKGTAVASVSLAVNRKWKSETGEAKEEVTFVECTAFGRTAETMGQYLKKGRPVFVEGRLKLDVWDDKQTGAKRQKLHVVVETFQFVGSKADGDSQSRSPHDQTAGQRAGAEAPQPDPQGNEDDAPF